MESLTAMMKGGVRACLSLIKGNAKRTVDDPEWQEIKQSFEEFETRRADRMEYLRGKKGDEIYFFIVSPVCGCERDHSVRARTS